jgi:hypothetical protein
MYLAGVSIGFDRARVGVFQTLASRRRRGAANVPLSRADLYRSDRPDGVLMERTARTRATT